MCVGRRWALRRDPVWSGGPRFMGLAGNLGLALGAVSLLCKYWPDFLRIRLGIDPSGSGSLCRFSRGGGNQHPGRCNVALPLVAISRNVWCRADQTPWRPLLARSDLP